MKTIVVTGTPCTGKTTLAKNLARMLNFLYLDVNKVISKYRLSEGYDKKRKTRIVDVYKLNKLLINLIEEYKKFYFKKRKQKFKGIVIDSHLSHYLPKKYVDLCIVAKCDIKELNKRLKKRKYNVEKIKENIQAEIFDICYNESKELGHKVFVVDTTKGFNIKDLFQKIKAKL